MSVRTTPKSPTLHKAGGHRTPALPSTALLRRRTTQCFNFEMRTMKKCDDLEETSACSSTASTGNFEMRTSKKCYHLEETSACSSNRKHLNRRREALKRRLNDGNSRRVEPYIVGTRNRLFPPLSGGTSSRKSSQSRFNMVSIDPRSRPIPEHLLLRLQKAYRQLEESGVLKFEDIAKVDSVVSQTEVTVMCFLMQSQDDMIKYVEEILGEEGD